MSSASCLGRGRCALVDVGGKLKVAADPKCANCHALDCGCWWFKE